jgi:hypothetical protein
MVTTKTTLRLRSATEQKSSAKRRRNSNPRATYSTRSNRMNTSCGQPVHISSYLTALMNEDGSINREKFINSFNSECYG